MKSLAKLKKQREKYRNKIIKEFGNSILKLCSTEVLKQIRKDQKALEKKYVFGTGSFEMEMNISRYEYENRFKEVMRYFETLEFIEKIDQVVTGISEDALTNTKITVKFYFVVPESEIALGDRFYKPN